MLALDPVPMDLIGKVILSAFLGALVGLERDLSGHPAGLRTNMIVCMASCLFTIVSYQAAFILSNANADPSRIAAGIVVGVGFLGAGTLIHTKSTVHGLTTAAGIWMVAAIGMAIGAGMEALAIFITLFGVIAMVLLNPLSKFLDKQAEKGKT